MPDDRLKESFKRSRIGVDVAKYQAMLDAPDLSDDDKEALLKKLWYILMVFVDLGFELHPVEFPCGQLEQSESSECSNGTPMVELEQFLEQRFEDVARD